MTGQKWVSVILAGAALLLLRVFFHIAIEADLFGFWGNLALATVMVLTQFTIAVQVQILWNGDSYANH